MHNSRIIRDLWRIICCKKHIIPEALSSTLGQGRGEEGEREVEKATFPPLFTMIVGLFYWILYNVIVCMQEGSAVLTKDIVLF